jgi:hyperosmotically inducible protein
MANRAPTLITILLLVAASGGCEREGPAEQAGEKIDQAAEATRQQIEQTTEDAGQKLEEAGDSVREETTR